MLGVFAINVYIGLYDTNLSQLNSAHWDLNWLIAVADLVAATILLVGPGNFVWKLLAGILWPIVYVASLVLDVETRLCLGSQASACSPTVSDAYQYLILGRAGQEWILWQYTIPLAIALVLLTLILTLLTLYLSQKEKSSPAASTRS